MNTSHQLAIRLTLLAVVVSLGGCLSEVDSQTNPVQESGASTNRAPNISGNPPAAVQIGAPYSFTPQASDPDGDALTFSIQNKPIWATFDTNTGDISGTPTLGDVGSYSNIGVTVSDGELSASMSNFTVDVTQVSTTSTTLSWIAPTENEDSTALTDLAGFTIYYGRSSGNYSNQIRIDNPSVTTYVIDNLLPDTYYFATTAFNSAGIESRFSSEAVTALN